MFHFSPIKVRSLVRKIARNVNSPYRLTITNEQSHADVVQFQLTKKSVYILFSTLFVLLFILFSLLIFFTPLKYYVPGNQQSISRKEMIRIKQLSDSVLVLNRAREKYVADLAMICQGKTISPDTSMLSEAEIKQALERIESNVDRASNYEYLKVEQRKRADSLKQAEANKDNLLISDEPGR